MSKHVASPVGASYQPTSRRPIGQAFRATAKPAVRWCVRAGVHPDLISYGSIVAAAIAGAMFWLSGRWPLLLLAAPVFAHLRLWLNMLDGMVAIESGKASLRGEILNDLPDRISDVLIFVGVAHSGLCHVISGYWAAIFALLTAYVGVFGQAVRVRREYSGIMSKPWRMVALTIGAWITLASILFSGASFQTAGLSLLDLTCIVIVLGCIQTIGVRLARIIQGLKAQR